MIREPGEYKIAKKLESRMWRAGKVLVVSSSGKLDMQWIDWIYISCHRCIPV